MTHDAAVQSRNMKRALFSSRNRMRDRTLNLSRPAPPLQSINGKHFTTRATGLLVSRDEPMVHPRFSDRKSARVPRTTDTALSNVSPRLSPGATLGQSDVREKPNISLRPPFKSQIPPPTGILENSVERPPAVVESVGKAIAHLMHLSAPSSNSYDKASCTCAKTPERYYIEIRYLQLLYERFLSSLVEDTEDLSPIYNRFVRAFVNCNALGHAARTLHELLERGHHPDHDTFAALIEGYAARGACSRALRFFELMLREGLKPSAQICEKIIEACVADERAEAALHIGEEMQRLGVHPTHVTGDALVVAHLLSGDHDRAKKCIEQRLVSTDMSDAKLRKKTIHSMWSTLLNSRRRPSHVTVLAFESMAETMRRQGISLPPFYYSKLIVWLNARQAFDLAHRVYLTALAHVGAKRTVLNAAIWGAAEAGRPDLAEEVFSQFAGADSGGPNLVTFNGLLHAHAKTGDTERVRGLYRRMLEAGITPDLRTYNLLLKAYTRAGQLSEARQVYDVMVSAGVRPDVYTFNTLMSGHYANRDWRGVVWWSGELAQQPQHQHPHHLRRGDAVTVNILLSCVLLNDEFQLGVSDIWDLYRSTVLSQPQSGGSVPPTSLHKGLIPRLIAQYPKFTRLLGATADSIARDAVVSATAPLAEKGKAIHFRAGINRETFKVFATAFWRRRDLASARQVIWDGRRWAALQRGLKEKDSEPD
ncbi:uncharacterized protein VTP21DRAFT_7830 [Calcarisporiella thermophila]|uniref:uncharacterized protein n=1 Tax=Calcarisporiella thermophila TaxID=911321 RepID=UPI0037430FF4